MILTSNVVTPGPGSYVTPSDFGIYESRNKEKFEEREKKGWKNGAERLSEDKRSTRVTTNSK